MSTSPLTIEYPYMTQLAIAAGELALSFFGRTSGQWKADQTLVSEADKQVETFLRTHLAERYPGTAILGEEYGPSADHSPHLWVLDPIDGTAAFLNRFPIWGVSIGYLFKQKPTWGLFYLPVTGDLFLGDDHGAFRNGDPLPALAPTSLNSESLLLIPSDAHRRYKLGWVGKTRSYGSVAAHVCYLASGQASAALLGRANIWDIAGVLPLLRQQGGNLYTLSGQAADIPDLVQHHRAPGPLLAAPTWLLQPLLSTITQK